MNEYIKKYALGAVVILAIVVIAFGFIAGGFGWLTRADSNSMFARFLAVVIAAGGIVVYIAKDYI